MGSVILFVMVFCLCVLDCNIDAIILHYQFVRLASPLDHLPYLTSFIIIPVTVVSEKYDEVVFTNPKASFHQSLLNGHTRKKNTKKQQQSLPYPLSNEPNVMEHFRTYGDESEVKSMLAAKKFLEDELRNIKDRILRADAELEEVKHTLAATKDLEGLLVPGGVGGVSGTAIPTSSKIGIKAGTASSATSVVVTGSKGNSTSGRAAGGKTLKKKAPPPPPSTTTSSSAALEIQQPTGKKLKSTS